MNLNEFNSNSELLHQISSCKLKRIFNESNVSKANSKQLQSTIEPIMEILQYKYLTSSLHHSLCVKEVSVSTAADQTCFSESSE